MKRNALNRYTITLLWFTKVLITTSLLSEDLVTQQVLLERHKRYLLYPDGDPARVQLIIGLGVPVDLEDQSVTIGYVIKILYHIPQVPEDYSTQMFNSASIVRAFGSAHQDTNTDNHRKNITHIVGKGGNIDIGNNALFHEGDENDLNGSSKRVQPEEVESGIKMPEGKFTEKISLLNRNKNINEFKNDLISEKKFISISSYENNNEREDKQNENVKKVETDHLETFTADVGSRNDDLKSEKEDNKSRRKRVKKRRNANFVILNKNNKEDADGRVAVYSEGETITDKESNDGHGGAGGGPTDERVMKAPKTTRWDVYKVFENMMEQKGFVGRSCMLRTICEAADTPFTHKNGILGELVHIVLTPSSTIDDLSNSKDKDYHTAEMRGKMDSVDCKEMYPDCEASILELFSEIGMDHFLKG